MLKGALRWDVLAKPRGHGMDSIPPANRMTELPRPLFTMSPGEGEEAR